MKPTRDQLQHYLLAAERAPGADPQTSAWARRVLEETLMRAERAERNSPVPFEPKPERHAYHTRQPEHRGISDLPSPLALRAARNSER